MKRKMGAPKKPAAKRLSATLQVRLTRHEASQVRQIAKRSGKTPAAFLRGLVQAAIGNGQPDADEMEWLRAVGAIPS